MLTPIRLLQFFHLSRHFSVLFYAFFLPFLGFSKDEIGSFELLLVLAFSFSFFWVSGLIQGLMHVYPSLLPTQKKKILFQTFILFSLLSAISIVIIIAGIFFEINGFQYYGSIPFIWVFLLFFFINTPSQLLEYVLFLEDKINFLKILCLLSFPIQILFFSIPLYFSKDIGMGVAGLMIWALIRFIFLFFLSFFSILSFDGNLLIKLIKYSFPLIFSALVGGLATVVNAVMVQFYYNGNAAIFAIYRYGARELPFVNGLFEGLGLGIVPSLVKNLQDGLISLKKNTLLILHLIFPISILLMIYIDAWFPFIFSKQFQDSIPVFKIFLFLIILRIIPTNPVINALGKAKLLAIIGLLELIIHISCSFAGLKWFGLTGMAMATCVAYSFEKFSGLIILWRSKGILLNDLIPVRWWLFYSILLIGSYFIKC